MDEFSRAKGEAWASQVIERDGKFQSEKICYAMNRSITGPREYEGIDRLYYNEDGTMKRIQMTTEGVQQVQILEYIEGQIRLVNQFI